MFALFWVASAVHSQDDRFVPEIDGLRMDRAGYSLIWNEELNIPKLVCYELKLEELGGSSCDGARYHADPNLDEYAAAAYEGAFDLGYEKGHLLPNRHGRWSEDACEHTSYYSNILPQKTSLNRGPWDQLDDRVEQLISKLGTVYVLLDQSQSLWIHCLQACQCRVAFGKFSSTKRADTGRRKCTYSLRRRNLVRMTIPWRDSNALMKPFLSCSWDILFSIIH